MRLRPRDDGGSAYRQLHDWGLWWVVPLFRPIGKSIIGVALRPCIAFAECPVVYCNDGVAMTIATNLSHSLPAIIYHASLRALGRRWLRLSDADNDFQEAIGTLGRALGATENAWHRLIQIFERSPEVADDTVRCAPEQRLNACAAVLSQLEEHACFASYRRWLDGLTTYSQEHRLADIENFGSWRQQALWLMFLDGARYRAHMHVPAVAWTSLTGPASLDSCVSRRGVQPATLDEGRVLLNLKRCARALLESSDAAYLGTLEKEPLWHVCQAINDKGQRYAGEELLPASDVLQRQGRLIEAWDALVSASFWSHRQKSEHSQILGKAQALAATHSWHDIASFLAADSRS